MELSSSSGAMSLAELDACDVRTFYGQNLVACNVALWRDIPFKGIALKTSGNANGREKEIAGASTVSYSYDRDTRSLDIFLRIVRVLLAFGLEISQDVSGTDLQSQLRIVVQKVLWANFGRNERLDQRIKSSVVPLLFADAAIEPNVWGKGILEDCTQELYDKAREIWSTEDLLDSLLYDHDLKLMEKYQFQIAWFVMTKNDEGDWETTWLEEQERLGFFQFQHHSDMSQLSDHLNKPLKETPTRVVVCEFPPFIQIRTIKRVMDMVDHPWNFVLEDWCRTDNENGPLKYTKRVYKLLVLWRLSNKKKDRKDDCIIFDFSGHPEPAQTSYEQDLSFRNSQSGTEWIAMYTAVFDDEDEAKGYIDDRLDPELAEAWNQQVVDSKMQHDSEKTHAQPQSAQDDTSASDVSWSITSGSEQKSPTAENRGTIETQDDHQVRSGSVDSQGSEVSWSVTTDSEQDTPDGGDHI